MQSIRLQPCFDFSPHIPSSGVQVAQSVGPQGELCLLYALNPLDVREENGPHTASFPKAKPDQPQTYHAVSLQRRDNEPTIKQVTFEKVDLNVHYIQPLAAGWLLVGARCRRNPNGDTEINGRVYNASGQFEHGILLGDGIKNVQVTVEGTIWTSYFDEGIFGNQPMGCSGLAAWQTDGKRQYEFKPLAGMVSIADCYALNVASKRDTYFYYYTPFHLVHLRDQQIVSFWPMPVAGARCFAIRGNRAIFSGGYRERNVIRLYALEVNSDVVELAAFQPVNEYGEPLVPGPHFARGDSMYFLNGGKLYVISLSALPPELAVRGSLPAPPSPAL